MRKNNITFAGSLTLISGIVIISTQSAGAVTSGLTYKLVSACSTTGQVMAVANDSLSDNAAIVLAARNDLKSSQVFRFDYYGAGFKIMAMNSGKTLNIAKASTASSAALEQYKFTGVSSEIFTVESTSDGYTRLKNVNSGLYVNLVKAITTNGNPFEQWLNTTACAEKFKLVAFNMASPSPSPSPSASPKPSPSPTPSPSPSPSPSASVGVRDPLQQPFASNSIWNMPIGSGAIYKPAGLSATPGYPASNYIWAKMPGADEEYIFMDPTAPVTPVYYSSAAWTGANRCTYSSTQLIASVPMPSSFIVPNNSMNNGAAFLLSDHRTIAQMQPLARCTAGGYGTSLLAFPNVDIYGDGRRGGHGGSGLSSIGGSIRMGELRPGQQGPRHALKINVYAEEALYNCPTQSDCFRWPAFNADSGAVNRYGTLTNNMNSDMKMGALLAIPASVNINNMGLETAPGKQLAWTFQNYGAYIVDDQGVPGFAISTEKGPAGSKVDEFQRDYGFAFSQVVNNQASSPWVRDLQRLVKALNVVSNNSATSIGGGGAPLQPLAAPIAP